MEVPEGLAAASAAASVMEREMAWSGTPFLGGSILMLMLMMIMIIITILIIIIIIIIIIITIMMVILLYDYYIIIRGYWGAIRGLLGRY